MKNLLLGYSKRSRRVRIFVHLFLALQLSYKTVSAFCVTPWSLLPELHRRQIEFSMEQFVPSPIIATSRRTSLAATATPATMDAKNQTSDDADDLTSALTLQEQAAALRAEAESLEKSLRAAQEAKRQKELDDIDRWIKECLYVTVQPIQRRGIPSPSFDNNDETEDKDVNSTIIDAQVESVDTSTPNPSNEDDDDSDATLMVVDVEWLNSVETAAQVLRDERYSHEQVSKMFDRICDTSTAQSRSNCSPLLALLVDAAGKLDCVERKENPNKRWDGRVERDLRKRLFCMDWGMELEKPSNDSERFL